MSAPLDNQAEASVSLPQKKKRNLKKEASVQGASNKRVKHDQVEGDNNEMSVDNTMQNEESKIVELGDQGL